MLYIIDTGSKLGLKDSISKDKSEPYYADARTIVDFEKILANNTADPELTMDSDVSIKISQGLTITNSGSTPMFRKA